MVAEAQRQATFNLTVLLPAVVPAPATAAAFAASGLPAAFQIRGDAITIADYGNGDVFASDPALADAVPEIDPQLRATVAGGGLGYAWQDLRGRSVLIVGGRQLGPPDLYFLYDATPVDRALDRIRLAILAGVAVAVLLALLAAHVVARGFLRPVGGVADAARRLADGDLSARAPVRGGGELADLARAFNRAADALQAAAPSLEREARRGPLSSPGAVGGLPGGGHGPVPAGLTDTLAEPPAVEAVDLGRLLEASVAARLPGAVVALPPQPVVAVADARRLGRIVDRLVDSVARRSPDAMAELSVVAVRDGAVVTVADRGPAVPHDALARLFERRAEGNPPRSGASADDDLAGAAADAATIGASLRVRARPGGGLILALAVPRAAVTGSLPLGDAANAPAEDAGAHRNP